MLNRTNREPVVPIVVILRIDTTAVEVQVAGIACRVERSRPVVAVRAAVVPRRTIAVAGASKEEFSATSFYDHPKESNQRSYQVSLTFSRLV